MAAIYRTANHSGHKSIHTHTPACVYMHTYIQIHLHSHWYRGMNTSHLTFSKQGNLTDPHTHTHIHTCSIVAVPNLP